MTVPGSNMASASGGGTRWFEGVGGRRGGGLGWRHRKHKQIKELFFFRTIWLRFLKFGMVQMLDIFDTQLCLIFLILVCSNEGLRVQNDPALGGPGI